MRIARIDHDGAPRAAVITADDRARRLPGDLDVLDLLTASAEEREAIAARAEVEVPLSDVRLLAPIAPPSIRDFSVFEAHIEGSRDGPGGTRSRSAGTRLRSATSPTPRDHRPRTIRSPCPPAPSALDLELEVAVVIGRAGRRLTVRARPAAHRRLHDLQRLLGARPRDATRCARLGFCKAKDFANTLGPWIVTADELEKFRAGDRLDLDVRASINGRGWATTRWPTWRGASRS